MYLKCEDWEEDYRLVMINETINEVMAFMAFVQCASVKRVRPDSDMFKGVTMLDDKLLPCAKLTLAQAMLELKKNPACVPFAIYLERWKYFNHKHKERNKLNEPSKPAIDDALLPSLMLTLPIAINKIKSNPRCVPFELYLKRWNELKTIKKHDTLTK